MPSSSSSPLVIFLSLIYVGGWGSGTQQEPQLQAIRNGPVYARSRTAVWPKGCNPLGRLAVIDAFHRGESSSSLSDLVVFALVLRTVVHHLSARGDSALIVLDRAAASTWKRCSHDSCGSNDNVPLMPCAYRLQAARRDFVYLLTQEANPSRLLPERKARLDGLPHLPTCALALTVSVNSPLPR